MAFIAFDRRLYMKFGFTDGHYAVMAFAAIAEYFQMVDKRDDGKSQARRCMTGFADIAGSEVIQRFTRNRTELVVMTICAG